jgi:hypothetical protein
MSTQDARQRNTESLQKSPINTTDLSGVQLPRDLFEEFIERTQEESKLLDLVRVEDLPRKEMGKPKVGVPEMSGGTRDEDGNRPETSSADTGVIEFNVTDQYYYIKYDLKEDAVEDTMSEEEVANLILSHFQTAWANDVQNIAINAGRTDSGGTVVGVDGGGPLDSTFDGWIAIADGDAGTADDRIGLDGTADVDTMPAYDHTDGGGTPQPVNTDLFDGMIQTVPERYRDPDDQVFMLSKSQVQSYHKTLTDRNDALGVAVLQGDMEVNPFAYDIVGIANWPDTRAMLINPEQLSYGLYEGLEITQQTETDKTMDEALHSRNLMEGQFDLQVEELQSGAIASGIAQP